MLPHKIRCFKYKFVDISETLITIRISTIENPIKISVFKAKFINTTLQTNFKMHRKTLYITHPIQCNCPQSQSGVTNSKDLDFNYFFQHI